MSNCSTNFISLFIKKSNIIILCIYRRFFHHLVSWMTASSKIAKKYITKQKKNTNDDKDMYAINMYMRNR